MWTKYILLASIITFIYGCEVKPHKINYGKDGCHFCKMTIVDTQHAAQFVTSKGKAYKFDAIECMVNQIKTWEGPEIKLYLVSNYHPESELIDAKMATYLISEAIPSPMGANLSSFKEKEEALKIQQDSGGELFNWEQLKSRL